MNDLDDGGDIGDTKRGRAEAHWRRGLGVKMLLLH